MVASQAANLTDKYYSEFSGMKSSDLGELYAQQNGWTFNKEKMVLLHSLMLLDKNNKFLKKY